MARFTKTKIVATLGPKTNSTEQIAALVGAGVDVFRINMSHADVEDARQVAQRIRRVSDAVAVLIDTRGPELRTTDVSESFELQPGSTIELRAGTALSTPEVLYVQHPDITSRLPCGVVVYVDDGLIQLRVESAGPDRAICFVDRGGLITSRRGVNVPGVDLSPPELSDADLGAIRLAAEVDAEFIAASFVQSAADVERIRREVGNFGGDSVHIIAKIESRRAVDDVEAILEASDGLMVARGDLGVEIPPEEVPLVQKRLVRMCNAAAKPVIVATQMLESMIENPVATRAETSDVANAIIDGADGIMLSGETAKGKYPLEAVLTMGRISDFVEQQADLFQRQLWRTKAISTDDFIAKAVCRASEDLDLDYIVALTTTGGTARRIASYRPPALVLACTPVEKLSRQLNLVYGVIPVVVDSAGHYSGAVARALGELVDGGALKPEHKVAVAFGVPMGQAPTTNFLGCDSVKDLIAGTRAPGT